MPQNFVFRLCDQLEDLKTPITEPERAHSRLLKKAYSILISRGGVEANVILGREFSGVPCSLLQRLIYSASGQVEG